MYLVGEEEAEALARVVKSGALFRYGVGSECDRFEERYAEYLGTKHVALTTSGTFALTASSWAMVTVASSSGMARRWIMT